jgi:hypothetical protein
MFCLPVCLPVCLSVCLPVHGQSATFGLDVVGEWEASHFNWKDSLTIDADGRFARGSGEQGSLVN